MESITKVLCFSLFLLVMACQSDSDTSTAQSLDIEIPKQQALILIDKSQSLSDSVAQKKLQQPLIKEVCEFLKSPNDRVRISFIHSNTLSGKYEFEKTFDWKQYSAEDLNAMNGKTRRIAKQDTKDAIISSFQEVQLAIKKSFQEVSKETTSQRTDLWGAFEVASRFFASNEVNLNKRLYFVSDMEESMVGKGRRNFTSKPPKDKQQAESWAETDASWITENLTINKDHLTNTEIYIYLPARSQSESDYQYIRYYWEALFDKFEMKLVQTY